MLDAGHGGTDPGAVSPDKRTYEKTLTLDITGRLARKISEAYPDVKVIQSRPADKFVALADRAQCANKAGADLFISIHINSSKSQSPHGYSVHVLGQSSNKDRDLFAYNMDVCRQENSVIMLENDYNTTYQGFDPADPESFIFMQLMQNSHLEQSLELAQIISEQLNAGPIKSNKGIWQNPFLVLWKTAMPSVLVEIGFLSNPSDIEVLRQESNRDLIADRLFDAFSIYKGRYDASVNIEREEQPHTATPAQTQAPAPAPSPAPATVPAAKVLYGTQIMAVKKLLSPSDKSFLGFAPRIVEVNGLYKYIIGCSASESEARQNFKSIRSKYPDAFMVVVSEADSSVLQPSATKN